MSLVSHWKLNETSGTTIADSEGSDSGGLSADASGLAVGSGGGPGGDAADAGLDLTLHHIGSLDSQSDTNTGGASTVSAFVKCDDPSPESPQAIYKGSGPTNQVAMYVYGGKVYYLRVVSYVEYYAAVDLPDDGEWHHVIGWHDAATGEVGVAVDVWSSDVESCTSLTTSGTAGSSIGDAAGSGMRLHTGVSANIDSCQFDGDIAWVKLFDSDESDNALTLANESTVLAPIYTSGASLSTAGGFSAGIWDNQQNGTLTYTCELRSSDGYVRETVSASSGTFTLTPNVGDALWVKVENDGGADVGDDGAGYYKLATREATSYTEITEEDRSLRLRLLEHGPPTIDDEFVDGVGSTGTYGDVPTGWVAYNSGVNDAAKQYRSLSGGVLTIHFEHDATQGTYQRIGILKSGMPVAPGGATLEMRWRKTSGTGVVTLTRWLASPGESSSVAMADYNAGEWQTDTIDFTVGDHDKCYCYLQSGDADTAAEIEIDYIRVYQHDGTAVENAGWAVNDEFDNGSTAFDYGVLPNGWIDHTLNLEDAEKQYIAIEDGVLKTRVEKLSEVITRTGIARTVDGAIGSECEVAIRWRRIAGSGAVTFRTSSMFNLAMSLDVNAETLDEWQVFTATATPTGTGLQLRLLAEDVGDWAAIEIDYITVNIHATLSGGKDLDTVSTTGPTEHLPKALAFDGVADYVDPSLVMNQSEEWTAAVWLNGVDHANTAGIGVFGAENLAEGGLLLDEGNAFDQYRVPMGGWTDGVSAARYLDAGDVTGWVHYAASWSSNDGDSGTIRFYRNGTLSEAVPLTAIGAAAKVEQSYLIGKRHGVTATLEADIAQPAVYARALSADEILHLANGPAPRHLSGGSVYASGEYDCGLWSNLDSPGILYEVDLRSPDGTVKESATGSTGNFDAAVMPGDQLWVRCSTDGGYVTEGSDGDGYFRLATKAASSLHELDSHQALAVHLRLQDSAADAVVRNDAWVEGDTDVVSFENHSGSDAGYSGNTFWNAAEGLLQSYPRYIWSTPMALPSTVNCRYRGRLSGPLASITMVRVQQSGTETQATLDTATGEFSYEGPGADSSVLQVHVDSTIEYSGDIFTMEEFQVSIDATLEGGGTTLANTTTGPGRGLDAALKFDGSADWISTPVFGPSGDAAATASCWFKCATTGQDGLVAWGDDSAGKGFAVSVENGVVWERSVTGRTITWGSGYNDDEWHHLVLVKPEGNLLSTMKCYVDGVLLERTSLGTDNIDIGTADEILFASNLPGSYRINGDLADVRVYATDLSAAEVGVLYRGELRRRRGALSIHNRALPISATVFSPVDKVIQG